MIRRLSQWWHRLRHHTIRTFTSNFPGIAFRAERCTCGKEWTYWL